MRIPTTPLALRVAALVKRRPTTPWSAREISVYRRLVKSGFYDDLDNLLLVEQYYAFERKKGEHGPNRGVHRRDLLTYLNNAPGELDRATLWREAHPLKPPPRKIIPMPPVQSEPYVPPNRTPAEQAAHEKFLEELQQRKQAKGKA